MSYMRIQCDYCGGHWEVYHRDDWHNDRARTCPHCYQKIDRQLWDRQVLPAFSAVEDLNKELYKEHAGYHHPLFQIGFYPDIIFTNRWRKET